MVSVFFLILFLWFLLNEYWICEMLFLFYSDDHMIFSFVNLDVQVSPQIKEL